MIGFHFGFGDAQLLGQIHNDDVEQDKQALFEQVAHGLDGRDHICRSQIYRCRNKQDGICDLCRFFVGVPCDQSDTCPVMPGLFGDIMDMAYFTAAGCGDQ